MFMDKSAPGMKNRPRLHRWLPLLLLPPLLLALGAQAQPDQPRANLSFLFAAYTIAWAAFFAYAFFMTRRQGELKREIEALRKALEARESNPRQGTSPS